MITLPHGLWRIPLENKFIRRYMNISCKVKCALFAEIFYLSPQVIKKSVLYLLERVGDTIGKYFQLV